VLDFGIAKAMTQVFKTSSGIIVGTPAYMSPEQAQGRTLDARSDLYSLGVIAFECIEGRRPFDGDSAVAILLKHVSDSPPRLTKGSPELRALVARLLSKLDRRHKGSSARSVVALEGMCAPGRTDGSWIGKTIGGYGCPASCWGAAWDPSGRSGDG
jgi:serine/threonine-protein kinase